MNINKKVDVNKNALDVLGILRCFHSWLGVSMRLNIKIFITTNVANGVVTKIVQVFST